ncbi:hypothetical protein [Acetobacter oeni]|uniref:Uncharacterized protein n=1 Tax=Acetobacter oeni TaxID=304077 RepID=A0A511XNT9_9PROT|nr:hypothetical protein [Acetobacter oeni]MBB3881623.1 hypothetical protein [Acetobacter oeni]NHO17567.1 hypothetical protein [Acetobacter oeni]GBR00940.1 hypothetical protein AA21952_0264 [Acetobacter oeni LMG 21952]GEN64622.1 hypothetical protein AOE01nite_28460 [Acetobacter oeni]
MTQFRLPRSPITSTAIVRMVAIGLGAVFLAFAVRFALEMPDVMPGNAAGILALVALGTILILGAIWIAI